MRIVAGIFKGRVISAPKGEATRPTTDRVREALMSSVVSAAGGSLEGLRVLDAFAGSGALGLEALSRGATHCVFYDRDKNALATLRSNIAQLGLVAQMAQVCAGDVLAAATRGGLPAHYDLVFLDPPYDLDADVVCNFILNLARADKLSQEALIIYEYRVGAFDFDTSKLASSYTLVANKKYGKTGVSLMRYLGMATGEGREAL